MNNTITEIVETIKSGKEISLKDILKLNPVEKQIVKIVENEKMTPGITELVEKLIYLSDMISGKTEVPFHSSYHIYEIFDPTYGD